MLRIFKDLLFSRRLRRFIEICSEESDDGDWSSQARIKVNKHDCKEEDYEILSSSQQRIMQGRTILRALSPEYPKTLATKGVSPNDESKPIRLKSTGEHMASS